MENNLAKEIFDDICTDNQVKINPVIRDRMAVQFKENMQIAEDMESVQLRHVPGTKSDHEIIQELEKELDTAKEKIRILSKQKESFNFHEMLKMFREAHQDTSQSLTS